MSFNRLFYREFVDGDFDIYLNNVKLLDGSVVFWVIEVEIIVIFYCFDKDIFVKIYFNG